ncbi:carboxylating nicotinate-nucleotide diphosphorylase [Pontiella sulfatireligans]|uniref:Probable nicotinate-nucleotide pyrophosphorylase [carboxylating] n=1 Tax=Pontiella sulfatireligans TaxID=2750658 RepID=A0A6C2UD50_9BACT|nr:carboxylating nicotinate-nucleotide diphosphorylase [Pontiella sulfatireligans]VGO18118.1 Nicotinate-nucleotide pyrophosphorylase [carboxylating] [Pontiella sulfatireligans]
MYLPNIFERKEVRTSIALALEEDLGESRVDVTSESLVSPEAQAVAHLVAREACVIAGVAVAKEVFLQVNPELEVEECVADGTAVEAMTNVLVIKGSAKSILTAERTALNFIQRMCGVATVTAAYVKAAANPEVDILCTRKTTPLLRPFEKYSVRCGGGVNHRYGLFDAVLIKDNHLASWERTHGNGVGEAVAAARKMYPELKIEVEVDTIEQLRESLETKPDWVLLDNMPPPVLRECVALCVGICKTEASGGINLSTVYDIAQTGVDAISVGALTHSAPSIDLALDFV